MGLRGRERAERRQMCVHRLRYAVPRLRAYTCLFLKLDAPFLDVAARGRGRVGGVLNNHPRNRDAIR